MAITILLSFAILLILLITGLLVCPLILTFDTTEEKYQVQLLGIVKLKVVVIDDLPGLRLNLPFYSRDISLIKAGESKKKKPTTKKDKPRKKKKGGPPMSRKQFMAIIRTFRIRRFYVSLDTGDYVKNALLVPLFQWITSYGNQLEVNFNDETIIRFKASNNLWRLGTAYLRTAS